MCLRRAPRTRRTAIVIAVVVCVLLPTASAAEEAPPTRAEELEREIGEAGAAEVAALQELIATQGRLAAANSALTTAIAELGRAQTAVEASMTLADDASAKYFELFYEVERSEARVRGFSAAARSVAVDIYVTGPASAELAFIGNYADHELLDAGARDVYLDSIAENRHDLLDTARTALVDLEQTKRAADELRLSADAALAVAADSRAVAQTRSDDLADSQAELATAEAAESHGLEAIRERKAEFENELAALAAESGSIAQMLIARQSSQPRGTLSLQAPVDGPIVSDFGPRMHPILGYVRLHTGIDMDGDTGDEIRAAASGVVAWAGERGGYGNCVIIDHGNQFATLYAHQSSVAVQIGDTVRRGETIGYVGSTGMSTGPHLHFEVRDLGIPEDPEPYF